MIPDPTAGVRRALVIVLSTAAAALASTACGPAEPGPRTPMDVDTYVNVMSELADLERFPSPGGSQEVRSSRTDSVRRVILERHGVTADELLEFAEIVGSQPHRMVEIVDRMKVITDSLARARTGGRPLDPTPVDAADIDSAAGGDAAGGDAAGVDAAARDAAARDADGRDADDDTQRLPRRLQDLRELRDAEKRAP